MAPEMTTVSNPKSSPPSAPVSVAFIRGMLGRMVFMFLKFQTILQTGSPCGKPIPSQITPWERIWILRSRTGEVIQLVRAVDSVFAMEGEEIVGYQENDEDSEAGDGSCGPEG